MEAIVFHYLTRAHAQRSRRNALVLISSNSHTIAVFRRRIGSTNFSPVKTIIASRAVRFDDESITSNNDTPVIRNLTEAGGDRVLVKHYLFARSVS